MAKLITDRAIKGLSHDQTITEHFQRGCGCLMIRRRADKFVGYYRYWKGDSKRMVNIGAYRVSDKSAGFTLAELRDKALKLARLRQEIAPQDLKQYLQQEENNRLTALREVAHKEKIEASRGTLKEMFDSYIAMLESRGASDARNAAGMFKRYCEKPFLEIANKKARFITPDDIILILRRMLNKGVTTGCNHARAYLHAAFAYGIKADNDPVHLNTSGKRYGISHNPVSNIPRQVQFEHVRDRKLSDTEIRDLWFTEKKINRVYWLLLKFCLACYGNRPQQLLRCTWEDVDFQSRTLTFIDSKGKGAKKRKQVIPLSALAMGILEELHSITGNNNWLFSLYGRVPVCITSISIAARELQPGKESRWTPKDIRRTATGILTRLKIPQEQRYLLQSRTDGSIESKHYIHDDRLSEKREPARQYTAELEKIIRNEVVQVIDIGSRQA